MKKNETISLGQSPKDIRPRATAVGMSIARPDRAVLSVAVRVFHPPSYSLLTVLGCKPVRLAKSATLRSILTRRSLKSLPSNMIIGDLLLVVGSGRAQAGEYFEQ